MHFLVVFFVFVFYSLGSKPKDPGIEIGHRVYLYLEQKYPLGFKIEGYINKYN